MTRLTEARLQERPLCLMVLLKESHIHLEDTGEAFVEEVDVDIFRMTTFSTSENVDGKEGRKQYAH